jgi:hypothetical protein
MAWKLASDTAAVIDLAMENTPILPQATRHGVFLLFFALPLPSFDSALE